MDNSENVTHRLGQFMRAKNMGFPEMERFVGSGNNTIRKAVDEGRSISSGLLTKVAYKFPELDMNWLIRGVGAMEFGGEIVAQKEDLKDLYKDKYFILLEKYTACLEAQDKEVN